MKTLEQLTNELIDLFKLDPKVAKRYFTMKYITSSKEIVDNLRKDNSEPNVILPDVFYGTMLHVGVYIGKLDLSEYEKINLGELIQFPDSFKLSITGIDNFLKTGKWDLSKETTKTMDMNIYNDKIMDKYLYGNNDKKYLYSLSADSSDYTRMALNSDNAIFIDFYKDFIIGMHKILGLGLLYHEDGSLFSENPTKHLRPPVTFVTAAYLGAVKEVMDHVTHEIKHEFDGQGLTEKFLDDNAIPLNLGFLAFDHRFSVKLKTQTKYVMEKVIQHLPNDTYKGIVNFMLTCGNTLDNPFTSNSSMSMLLEASSMEDKMLNVFYNTRSGSVSSFTSFLKKLRESENSGGISEGLKNLISALKGIKTVVSGESDMEFDLGDNADLERSLQDLQASEHIFGNQGMRHLITSLHYMLDSPGMKGSIVLTLFPFLSDKEIKLLNEAELKDLNFNSPIMEELSPIASAYARFLLTHLRRQLAVDVMDPDAYKSADLTDYPSPELYFLSMWIKRMVRDSTIGMDRILQLRTGLFKVLYAPFLYYEKEIFIENPNDLYEYPLDVQMDILALSMGSSEEVGLLIETLSQSPKFDEELGLGKSISEFIEYYKETKSQQIQEDVKLLRSSYLTNALECNVHTFFLGNKDNYIKHFPFQSSYLKAQEIFPEDPDLKIFTSRDWVDTFRNFMYHGNVAHEAFHINHNREDYPRLIAAYISSGNINYSMKIAKETSPHGKVYYHCGYSYLEKVLRKTFGFDKTPPKKNVEMFEEARSLAKQIMDKIVDNPLYRLTPQEVAWLTYLDRPMLAGGESDRPLLWDEATKSTTKVDEDSLFSELDKYLT